MNAVDERLQGVLKYKPGLSESGGGLQEEGGCGEGGGFDGGLEFGLPLAEGFKRGFEFGLAEASAGGAAVFKEGDEGVELIGKAGGVVFAEGLNLNGAGIDIDPGELGAEGLVFEFGQDLGEGEVGGGLGEVLGVPGREFLGGRGQGGADSFDLAEDASAIRGGDGLVDAPLNMEGPVAVPPGGFDRDFHLGFRKLDAGLFGGGLVPLLPEGCAPGAPATAGGGRGVAEARQFAHAEAHASIKGINLHDSGSEARVAVEGLKEKDGGEDKHQSRPGDEGRARLGEDPISKEGGEGAPASGEGHVNTHVGGGFFRRGDLGDPESPEDFPATHGDALKCHGETEEPNISREEEEGDAEEKAEIEAVAGRDKVKLVKEAAPEFGGKQTREGGDHHEEEGDGGVVGVDTKGGIGEVFDADGNCDEVAQPEEHPRAENETEEAVFPDEAEALPGVAHVFRREGGAGHASDGEGTGEGTGSHANKEQLVVKEVEVEELPARPGKDHRESCGQHERGGHASSPFMRGVIHGIDLHHERPVLYHRHLTGDNAGGENKETAREGRTEDEDRTQGKDHRAGVTRARREPRRQKQSQGGQ